MPSLRHPILLLFVAAIFLPSCAVSHVDFAPRDFEGAESPDGYPAITYKLETDDGRSSELRVWSAGVDRRGSSEFTTVRFGLEIENRFDEPLRLDVANTRVLNIDADDMVIDSVAEARTRGDVEIDPGDVGVVGLTFDLPSGVSPGDVSAFHLAWKVDAPREFEEHTPFRRAPTRDARPLPWRYGYPLYFGGLRSRSAYRYGLGLGFASSFYCW